jgi:putative addiction module CopG family antidote
MRSTKQLSITLPTDMAEMVRTKVESGEYASESEVIRDGLRALIARDRALEHWLREEVAPAYDEMKSDKSKSLSAEKMRATLQHHHEKREQVAKKKRL